MPSVAYKMAKENRRELSPIFWHQFNKKYQAFKAILSNYHNTNVFCLMSCVFCLMSCVLCLVPKISHPISHISYLLHVTPSTLLRLSFGPPSDLVRSCFGKHPNKVRTRSEGKRTECGRRVEGEWNKSQKKTAISQWRFLYLNVLN